MKLRTLMLLLWGVLCLCGVSAEAQVPAVPAAAPASGGCFAGLCSALSGCKLNCCSSPFGQLIGSMLKPVSIMTGGVIPTPCAGSAANALAAGQPGPGGTAAAIQQSEANAKARRAAVRYLGTVDCHYFPEAEAMLIAALRADTNECVRWEAAHAFANGCCCTKKTVEALTITVQASNRDGNPSEDSLRVRAEAYNALQRCLTAAATEPVRPEVPGAEAPLVAVPQPQPMTIALAEAQQTVMATEQELRPTHQARGDASILGAWARAKDSPPSKTKRLVRPSVTLPEPHLAVAPRLDPVGLTPTVSVTDETEIATRATDTPPR